MVKAKNSWCYYSFGLTNVQIVDVGLGVVNDFYGTLYQGTGAPGTRSVLSRSANSGATYVIVWESPEKQIFESFAGGSAVMYPGLNAVLAGSKPQALALAKMLKKKNNGLRAVKEVSIARVTNESYGIPAQYGSEDHRYYHGTATATATAIIPSIANLARIIPSGSLNEVSPTLKYEWIYP